MATAARVQREAISQNVKAGQMRNAQNGEWCGGKYPFGFKVGEDLRLAIREDQAAVVRRMFQLALEKNTDLEIARILNNDGVLTPSQWHESNRPRSSTWNDDMVSAILKNPVYNGKYYWKKIYFDNQEDEPKTPRRRPLDECVSYDIPKIISDADFDQVQSFRKRHVHKDAYRTFWLSQLVVCGVCGLPYTGTTTLNRGKTYSYYRCSSHSNGGENRCSNTLYPASLIEPYIWMILVRALQKRSIVAVVEDSQQVEDNRAFLRAEVERLNQEVERIGESRKLLIKKLRMGKIDEDEFDEQIDDLEDDKKKRLDMIRKYETELNQETPAEIAEQWEQTRNQYANALDMPVEFWRALAETLWKSVILFPKEGRRSLNLVFDWRFPPSVFGFTDQDFQPKGNLSMKLPKEMTESKEFCASLDTL
jgi:site-specific DNA recombinase